MSSQDYGTVIVRGLVFGAYGTTTPIELPVSGILEVDLSIANSYTLATGETLRGITFVQGTQEFLDHLLPDAHDDPNATLEIMVMLRAEPGGYFNVAHQDGSVSSEEKINVSSGADTTVGDSRIQAFYSLTAADSWRLEVPNWSSLTAYSATDSHWTDPNPTTMQAAITRIAAKLFALGGAIA